MDDCKTDPTSVMNLRVLTWNVNGYTSVIHEECLKLLGQYDLIFLTETKRSLDNLNSFPFPPEFTVFHNPHKPAQYHGVTMIVRKALSPVSLGAELNITLRRDSSGCNNASQGRVVAASLLSNRILVIGSYTPNAGTRGLKNIDYRTEHWDRGFRQLIDLHQSNHQHTVVLGDLNIAPEEKDVSHPAKMQSYAGFSSQERESYAALLSPILVNAYRQANPHAPGYTWIGQNYTTYNPHYGMRLDHILISPSLAPYLTSSKIHPEILASDHIPLSATIDVPSPSFSCGKGTVGDLTET